MADHIIKRKTGRGNKFDPMFITIAARMTANGKTLDEIALALGVKPSTIEKWKEKFPSFNDALVKPDEVLVDSLIETAFKHAEGYDYDEVTLYYINKPTQEEGKKPKDNLVLDRKVVKTKRSPANPDLLKFLLVNKANFKTSNDETTHKNLSVSIGEQTMDNFIEKLTGFDLEPSEKRKAVVNEHNENSG